jgi:hypothetical protein
MEGGTTMVFLLRKCCGSNLGCLVPVAELDKELRAGHNKENDMETVWN